MSALRECPFCGGAPMLRPDHNHSTGIEIECVADGCAVKPAVWEISEPAAIAAWNRRAGEDELATLRAEVERLRKKASASNEEIRQTLGAALGYPWLKDDQRNFPGATEADGVCVGDHVAESIAAEAAERIATLRGEASEWCQKAQLFEDRVTTLRADVERLREAAMGLQRDWPANTKMVEVPLDIYAALRAALRAALAKEPPHE